MEPQESTVAEAYLSVLKDRGVRRLFVNAGIEPGTAELLGQLCDEFAIGVLKARPRCYNVDPGHPLHLGYDLGTVAKHADVLIYLDMDVPWIAKAASPGADATVVQCGPDPNFSRYPIRTHRSDLSVTASTANLLAALAAALPGRGAGVDGRRAALVRAAEENRSRISERLVAASRPEGPITKAFMNWALGSVLPADASVVSEYWARPDLLPRSGPLSYFGTPPAGGLGWGRPTAATAPASGQPER